MTRVVHLLAPAGFATRPSGGNVYDRHLAEGLGARGWRVVVRQVTPGDRLPDLGADPVLADSQVVAWAAEALADADVRVIPLVHMLFGTPGERELVAAAPAVITTSRWTRRLLLTDPAVDPRRVHVATPGVDRARPHEGGPAGNRLLCVGALSPTKGQDVLLEALARLTDLDWRCTLVGSDECHPDFVDGLRKTAADHGLTDRVCIAGERVGAALEAEFAGADLAVLPSRAETYGMVVTEALARAVPVVATNVGGVPEALGDVGGAHPGLLVRPDARALAAGLRRWLEDPDLRRWVRRAALQRRACLGPWSATAGAVSQVLEDLR